MWLKFRDWSHPPPPRLFPPNTPITSVKYPGEARVRAGACMYKVSDRQIKNITANLGTRYEGKIFGDSNIIHSDCTVLNYVPGLL